MGTKWSYSFKYTAGQAVAPYHLMIKPVPGVVGSVFGELEKGGFARVHEINLDRSPQGL